MVSSDGAVGWCTTLPGGNLNTSFGLQWNMFLLSHHDGMCVLMQLVFSIIVFAVVAEYDGTSKINFTVRVYMMECVLLVVATAESNVDVDQFLWYHCTSNRLS